MAPPWNEMSAFCGSSSATELWLAGPRHEARVSSHRLQVARLAPTETPEPELEPSDAARVVS